MIVVQISQASFKACLGRYPQGSANGGGVFRSVEALIQSFRTTVAITVRWVVIKEQLSLVSLSQLSCWVNYHLKLQLANYE